MAEPDVVQEAARELYTEDPAEFTGRRAALAADARASGDAPAARAIAALRKPTRSAWVVNRLVHADPDVPSRLAALGSDLRSAEKALDGRRIRDLSQQRRELIRDLTRRALAEADQRSAPAGLQEEVSATLNAALADPEVADDLAAGRLLRPVEHTGFGFGDASPVLRAVPDRAAAARRERADRPRAGRRPAGSAPAARQPAPAERERATKGRSAGPRRAGKASTTDRARADRARAAEQARAEKAKAEQARAAERERAEAKRARAEEERRREALEAARRAAAEADQAVEQAEAAERDSAEAVEDLQRQLGEAYKRQADARRQARQAAITQRNAHRVLDRLDE